jgi:hypothetical protein
MTSTFIIYTRRKASAAQGNVSPGQLLPKTTLNFSVFKTDECPILGQVWQVVTTTTQRVRKLPPDE